jgi:hypothetical protein
MNTTVLLPLLIINSKEKKGKKFVLFNRSRLERRV